MIKLHDAHVVVIDNVTVIYFYIREKNDVNGNPRYRVFIKDPNADAVYETIFKCYDSQIPERVKSFLTIGDKC